MFCFCCCCFCDQKNLIRWGWGKCWVGEATTCMEGPASQHRSSMTSTASLFVVPHLEPPGVCCPLDHDWKPLARLQVEQAQDLFIEGHTLTQLIAYTQRWLPWPCLPVAARPGPAHKWACHPQQPHRFLTGDFCSYHGLIYWCVW